ncbi:hypothetical protein F9C11_38020 [Amycolatopsis sp. VS8301801F10]|uniref:hypothetical protein n=1 Tax=Amycolatopsis sp. VS8301801F10 TaxID=2652442 RepID=UPI0038FC92B4
MRGRVSGKRCALASAVLVLGGSAVLAPPAVAVSPFAEWAAQAREVALPTGDRLTVFPGANGGTDYAFSSPPRTAFQSYQSDGGDRYVIPADAVPFLGQLGKSLFDVTALAREKPGKIPLDLTFPAGTAPSALPGITLVSAAGNTATGYLENPAEFTAELHRRIAADTAAGRPPGSSVLPAKIRLAGAPGEARPQYPMKILELRLADLRGRSVNGLVSLVDTDSAARLTRQVEVDGVARIAVPRGRYAASASFSDFDETGKLTAARTSWVEGFVVDDSPGVQTLTVEEKHATAEITVTAPKAAEQDLLVTSFYREDATGRGFAAGVAGGTVKQYVRPVPKPAQGVLHYVVQWGGKAPQPEDRYRVDLSFASEGIAEDQSFSAKESELATVRDRLYADPADAMPVAIENGPVDPVIERHGLGAFGFFVPAPGVLTDYLGTAHTGNWVQYEQTGSTRMLMTADPRVYRPGSTTTVDWSRGPLTAGLGQWTQGRLCEVCYAGGTVSVAIQVLRDSVPDHTAIPLSLIPKTHFSLYRDEKQVFDGDAYGLTLDVPETPATFRGVLDVDRTAMPGVSQAGKLRTELTMRYDPSGPDASLPAPHRCLASDRTRPCRIMGALTVDYHLDADLSTTSSSPLQVLELHVGHAAYSGAGSHSPITSATVSVSADNGATWQPAQVFGLFGEYVAVWRNPPAGISPSLKVTARDLAGNAITQTISNAYTVGKAER